MIRLAVVGVGAFGQNHLRVIKESSRAELVAVVDLDRDKAQDAAEAHNCMALALDSIGDIAGRADAAIIATPTNTHAEIAETLLNLGLDVLVEKPIASDLDS